MHEHSCKHSQSPSKNGLRRSFNDPVTSEYCLHRDDKDVVEVAQSSAEASGLGLEPAMPLDVTNETPSAARMQLYQTQSCLFITTRILVVDFLVHRLQPSQVRRSLNAAVPMTWLPMLCLATAADEMSG